jgi:hypothetical protein
MAVEIQLTRGYVAVVDECDADLAAFKWHAQTSKNGVTYAARSAKAHGKKLHLYLHREIVGRVLGRKLGRYELVDHWDHIGTNCRRYNLRLATGSQNAANQQRKQAPASGVKGVHLERQTGRWKAQITVNYKCINLGRYRTLAEARKVRVEAVARYFGEFASPEES